MAETLSQMAARDTGYPVRVGQESARVAQAAKDYADSLTGAGDIATTSLAGSTHTTEGTGKLELMAVATYSFATDGGAVSTIGLGVSLPDNAIVTKVIQDVTTDLTSAGSGATLKLILPTDGDLSANITADGSNAGVSSELPSGTPVKTTAARELSVTIATEAVTAGAARWFVYYVQSA